MQSAPPRILLVDDMSSIHEDFRKVLAAASAAAPAALALEAELFDLPAQPLSHYELESAFQGREALACVEAAVREGRPYALAFVDMRMPPGWDGMETVTRLWQVDPQLQVVICTAYSDHPWEDLLQRLDVQDRLVILKKPFDMIEVAQLARALTTKWALARRSEALALQRELVLQRLQHSEQELRRTSEELRNFAHAVAHDLQAPLAMIVSFGQLLAQELGAIGEPAAQYLGFIRNNAQAGRDLVDGLLSLTDVARAELQPEEVDLGEIAGELVAQLKAAQPGRAVSLRLHPGLTVRCDRRLLQVAMRNLVENAWKFTSACPQANIEIGVDETAGSSDEKILFVRDNGCGFAMADASRLFQHFQRLHRQDEYPGTGVGLVTVQRVVQRHGGRIWADSAPGRGATFYLALPVAPPPGAPAR